MTEINPQTEKISPTVSPFEFDGAALPGQTFAEAPFTAFASATSSNPYVITISPNGASQIICENTTDAEITIAVRGPLRDAMRIKNPADIPAQIVTTVDASSGFVNDNPARRQFILPAGARVLVWPTTTPTQGKVRVKLYE